MEKQIQKGILDFLRLIESREAIYFFRSASGAVATDTGRFFQTGKPGTPDITICYHGRFIGLEVKTATGRQTPVQKIAQEQITAAGGEYHIVRSLEDVWQIFNYEPIKRKL